MHAPMPEDEWKPVGQSAQLVFPVLAYCPASQMEHSAWLGNRLKCPIGHNMQLTAPVEAAKVPSGHESQISMRPSSD